jgi:uncharacterized membrane protein (DUF373 family)
LQRSGAVADLKIARPAAREPETAEESRLRAWVAKGFTRVEDVVYVGLGVLLAASALMLLAYGAYEFGVALLGGHLPGRAIELLDRVLLILLVVEILYTVQVSFREHALAPEPFLIVGLIAVTRRILILTAEFEDLLREGGQPFRDAMLELGLLAVLVLVLVVSLVLLRRRGPHQVAEKA